MTPNPSELFDACYFATGCGRPYERDEEWLAFFRGIAARIQADIRPKSALDAGCALGFLVETLREREIEAFGVDISAYAIANAHESIRPFVWQGSVAEPLPRHYDLIVCIEVLEHMPQAEAEKALANFCAHTGDVLFSSTPFDYKEPTHFNVQPPEYWAEQFARHGFYRDVDFDASFITGWAARFRRSTEPAHRIVRAYERRAWLLHKENQDLRALTGEMRADLGRLEPELKVLRIEKEQNERAYIQQIHLLTRQVNEQADQIRAWHAHWATVTGGMAWRTVQGLLRLQPRLAPAGSRRYRLIQNLFAGTRNLARRLRREPDPAAGAAPPASGTGPLADRVAPPDSPRQYPAPTALPVALYTPDPWTAACAHLRVTGPAHHAGAGLAVLQGSQWEPAPGLHFPAEAEAIVIQRDFPRHAALYAQVIEWARAQGKPVIYELDDLLIELPPEHPEQAYYAPFRRPMLAALRDADAVIVSTGPLAEYARRFNANTWVLPNTLDDRLWAATPPGPGSSSPVVMGYMGGLTNTHLPDLELVTPVLLRLLKRYGNKLTLRFWGLLPPELEGVPNVEFRAEKFYSYPEFAAYFARQGCDLFIAPLRDNLFNRCKSPIKFIEYSALGIPGVYSRIAPYEGVVAHGVNGFLAAGEEAWEAHSKTLIENASLRREIGRAARQTVDDYLLMSKNAHEWGTVYRAALAAIPEVQTPQARALARMNFEQWLRAA